MMPAPSIMSQRDRVRNDFLGESSGRAWTEVAAKPREWTTARRLRSPTEPRRGAAPAPSHRGRRRPRGPGRDDDQRDPVHEEDAEAEADRHRDRGAAARLATGERLRTSEDELAWHAEQTVQARAATLREADRADEAEERAERAEARARRDTARAERRIRELLAENEQLKARLKK